MPQIRISDEAAVELKRRAEDQRRSVRAVLDLLLEATKDLAENDALAAAS